MRANPFVIVWLPTNGHRGVRDGRHETQQEGPRRKAAAAAMAAGVRLVACGNALNKFGIDPKKLTPAAEGVPNGVGELSRLVADGYAVIRY